MIKIAITSILLLLTFSSEKEYLSAYISYGYSSTSIEELSKNIKNSFRTKGFDFIGEYSPESNSNLRVLAFSSPELVQLSGKVKDRGILGAFIKVGLHNDGEKTELSLLNPEYILYAYWREDATELKSQWTPAVKKAREAMNAIGTEGEGFGGELKITKLVKYHYMFGMPYFDDPVELKTFSSFQEGVRTIEQNLDNQVASTSKIYSYIDNKKHVAVFGIGLTDPEDGEARFLPIIGERNIAAMPYEIVLEGNDATMLHGRFRFALHWPELSMGTFMKISSTPGYVEDTFESLTSDPVAN